MRSNVRKKFVIIGLTCLGLSLTGCTEKEEAKENIERIQYLDEDKVFETLTNELIQRIENKEESKNKSIDSNEKAYYLKDAKEISLEEADFSINQAFELFEPNKEVSIYEEEHNNLLSIYNRTDEQEMRLEEIKSTILGAVTISKSAYIDSVDIFRIGMQHYLYGEDKETIIYKIYKNGILEKIR